MENKLSTGNELSDKYGFSFSEAPQANWPDTQVKFMDAPEVKEIAGLCINKWRNNLSGFRIKYLFKQKASKSGDNITLGAANVESDKQKAIHGYDACVVIGFDTWVTATWDQKCALTLHELEHLQMDMDSSKLKVVPHAVEEFPLVMQYFGPGKDADVDFIHAYKRFSEDNTRGAYAISMVDLDK